MKAYNFLHKSAIGAIAVLLAIHFVSYAFFLHIHNFNGEQICHSHPFSGADHSKETASFIYYINTTAAVISERVTTPLPVDSITAVYGNFEESQVSCCTTQYHFLRAPPVSYTL